jgi:hypothetical protein
VDDDDDGDGDGDGDDDGDDEIPSLQSFPSSPLNCTTAASPQALTYSPVHTHSGGSTPRSSSRPICHTPALNACHPMMPVACSFKRRVTWLLMVGKEVMEEEGERR